MRIVLLLAPALTVVAEAGAVATGCEFCRAKWRRPLTRRDMIERWATGPSSDVSMSW